MDWRAAGRALQFDVQPSAQRMRLTIGLDFGTAFTKVVVADSASRRYVVTFEDALRATDAEACFLPGFLAVERSGLGWLGFNPSDSNVLADLKYQLLE